MGALTKTYNMAALNIYLPVQFNQLVDLIKSLPKKEKQQLIELLEQDAPETIPDWQKKEVQKIKNSHLNGTLCSKLIYTTFNLYRFIH